MSAENCSIFHYITEVLDSDWSEEVFFFFHLSMCSRSLTTEEHNSNTLVVTKEFDFILRIHAKVHGFSQWRQIRFLVVEDV